MLFNDLKKSLLFQKDNKYLENPNYGRIHSIILVLSIDSVQQF